MFSLVPTGSVARHIVRYAQIVLGSLLTSLGYNLFLIPAHLLTGGISGIAIVIYYLTGLPVGAQNFVYNLPILYLAYRVFGRHYAFDTIFGTVVLSVLLDLTHFVVDWNVCANIVLNSVFGGVLTGIGFGMVFRVNANTGGLDVVGAVVKKYYAIDMGTVIFVLNFLIVAGSAFVCTLEEMLFTFISIYVIAELTNRVAAGLLFAVVSLTQVGRVKTIVRHHDPQAFMIVSDTSEVTGKGFTLECESYADAKRKWEEQKARHRAAND